MSGVDLGVSADPPYDRALINRARDLSDSLGIPMVKLGDLQCLARLTVTLTRLEVRIEAGELAGGNAVYADLAAIDTTSPAGRKLDMPLLKAVGIKKGRPYRPSVIDATCGLGEDAWLLASHGCSVMAIERNRVIATLLSDAIERASQTQAEAGTRITLNIGDAKDLLPGLGDADADAITIDPMFPQGRKAMERKPMRVLRMFAGDDPDAPDLLDAALKTGIHRVCVKRPLHAPVVAHENRTAPDVVYKGKAVRFDVYFNNPSA